MLLTSLVAQVCLLGLAPGAPPPSSGAATGVTSDPARAAALRAKAQPLLEAHSKKRQLKGAKLLERAWEADKASFKAAVGRAQAGFVRAYWAEGDRARQRRTARMAIRRARKVIKRWPERAHGYYWVAASTGMLATASGILSAVEQGLAGKIERNGKAALKRDPTLYRGAVQRLLGRYYQILPWPLKKPKKAMALLEEAYRQDRDHVAGLQYLAEALANAGQSDRARRLFVRCAAGKGPDIHAPRRCKERL